VRKEVMKMVFGKIPPFGRTEFHPINMKSSADCVSRSNCRVSVEFLAKRQAIYTCPRELRHFDFLCSILLGQFEVKTNLPSQSSQGLGYRQVST
jgi:hypothetical protein